jgi:hypothetical protein
MAPSSKSRMAGSFKRQAIHWHPKHAIRREGCATKAYVFIANPFQVFLLTPSELI